MLHEDIDASDYRSFYRPIPLKVNPIIDDCTLRDG
ncbi:unnamed protein product, partial [marine sediment metagenome]